MTDSTEDKPTPRQPRLDPHTEDFNYDLADGQMAPEQSVSKNNAVDYAKTGSFSANNTRLSSSKVAPEIKANFYVDYFDKRKKAKAANSEPVSIADDVNESNIINDRSPQPMTTSDNQPPNLEEQSPDSNAPVVNGSGMAVAVLSQFKSKQESINKQQDKLIQEFTQKVKKATSITYAAVFFGTISLAAAAWLGLTLVQTKTQLSDLEGTTTALKDEIRNVKSPSDDMDGTDPSIEQLNQKVEEVTQKMLEVELLQDKVALLEKATGVKSSAANKSHAHADSDTTEKKQAQTAATVKTMPDTVAIKPTPVTTKPIVKNVSAEPATAVSPIATTKPQTAGKPVNKTNTPVKKESAIDQAIEIPANDINNVINSNKPQTVSGNAPQVNENTSNVPPAAKAATKTTESGGWTVNLASSNQLDDAKKTANSYAQKGVPVTISSTTVKNQTRYRLQVKGFKTKEEATAYGNKAKEMLNLNSVWINP